ncbi:MAG TPA: efflux RND transporter periplasmic adaptor subunit, partial [bacterium]|nr:efflux RND transporter periplasmic adaptor subunit [bacterium]
MLRRIEVTGTLESESFVEIMPEIPGTVVERRAEEGDRAQAGQILAVLDKTEIEIEVKRAQANLQQRQAELSQLLAGNRTEDIAVARAARDRAKAGHDNMLRNRERYQALHEKKIFTDKDWDDFIAQLDQARENLEAAEAELSKAQTGPRREEIEKARASVAAASADLALSRKRLSDTEIKAPFNGIISKRYLEVGERVETNRPVFSIYDDTALRVSVTVPENYIGVLAQGQRCEITVPAYPGEIFEGTVRVVGEQLDVTTRSLPVKVIVKSKEHRLLPGMFARVTVEMGWIDQAVVIPRDAVRFREGMPIAFVVKDGRAYERALDLGQSSMDQ